MQEKPCHLRRSAPKPVKSWPTVEGSSIMDVCQPDIDSALKWFHGLKLNEKRDQIAHLILKEIGARMQFCKM